MSSGIKSEEYKINDHLEQGLKNSEDMCDVLRCSILHSPMFSLDEKTWISARPNALFSKHLKLSTYLCNLCYKERSVTKTTVLKTSSNWSFFQSRRLKGSIPKTLSHSKAAGVSAIVWL